jgi:hypothetical protein
VKKIGFLLALLTFVLSACSAQTPAASLGSITIVDPWVRSAGAEMNTGGFMLLKNTGDKVDRLIKAEFSGAMMVEIHETKMIDNVMQMQPVEGVEIPANGSVRLKPGSYHVMFMGLKNELKEGEKIDLTLTFENAGTVTLSVDVRNP